MSVTWRKVWRDLWHNRLRTLLVVLSTAVGVFAIGFIFGTSGVMRAQMAQSHLTSNAPHIAVFAGRLDGDVVEAVRREPGVADVEGETRSSFRWRLEDDVEWREGHAIARTDFESQRMYPVELLEGEWPDGRTLAVERMTASYFNLPRGTTIVVDAGKREHRLTVTGVVRHPYTPPPQIGMGEATFCATPAMVAWLTGEEEGFTDLNIRLESFSQEAAAEAAERIRDRMERLGVGVAFYTVIAPDVHWGQDMMDTVFLILGVLGALSLGVSAFLIINVMNATLAQQVWQVGVMKVLGATFGRVARIYLVTALAYGVLSLLVAVPLGALAAHLLSAWLLGLFNIVGADFALRLDAVGVQVAVALVVPLVAAALPVIGGVRVSPHRAIRCQGLSSGFGRGTLDRCLGRVRCLPRFLALSLRNTFRHKGRAALTVLAMVIGGVVFIMVSSISASFDNTLSVLADDFGFDVWVEFDRPYHVTRLVEATESVPGVVRAEAWEYCSAQLALGTEKGNGEDCDVGLWGVPGDSQMFSPRVVNGRALLPDDDHALLLNNKIAVDEGFQVGDEVELTIGGRESTWTVVGLVLNINNDHRDSFVPFAALAQATGSATHGKRVLVASGQHSAESRRELVNDLHDFYSTRRLAATYFQSADDVRQVNLASFDVVAYLLLAMAVLAAAVGSIGIATTTSINVVERGREIAVMRAIGATSPAVAGIFVAEGVHVGMLSWLLAAPLSYPGARIFSDAVGVMLINVPLDFSYSLGGLALWLIVVLILSALASLWPAMRAARVSVRESLAYE